MSKVELDLLWQETDPLPERKPPAGGWRKPCLIEAHRWGIELEDGRASVVCLDPCDPDLFDSGAQGTPACLHEWYAEDFCTVEPIPVAATYVDDSTPSTPAGPAEYGFYVELRPA
jgi:hypothetical protein